MREVIVGDATHSRIPDQRDPSAWLNCYPDLGPAELERIETGLFPARVIEESNEDLEELAAALRGLGVTVHRPPAVDHADEYGAPGWRSRGRSSYCPRDLALVVGTTIIETPSPMRARYNELFGLRDLFQDYLLRGAHWLAAPKPRLRDELYEYDERGRPVLGEAEPAFEAANCLRLGRDVFYQVSRSGNRMGFRWLESTLRLLGEIRLHPLVGLYEGTHIDSTIALLRPGLVLLNPRTGHPRDRSGPAARLGRHLVSADAHRADGAAAHPEHPVGRDEPAHGRSAGRRGRRRPDRADRGPGTAWDRRPAAPAAARACPGRGIPLRHPRHRPGRRGGGLPGRGLSRARPVPRGSGEHPGEDPAVGAVPSPPGGTTHRTERGGTTLSASRAGRSARRAPAPRRPGATAGCR
ncbi:hypothetical protein GCM10027294_24480 [Marinactinospora endophytica]